MTVMRSEASTQPRGADETAPRRSWARRCAARVGWLMPAMCVVLVPKCPLCLAGYIAAAAGLGFAGKEVCGVPPSGGSSWAAPAGIALALALGIFWARRARHSSLRERAAKQ